MIRIRCQFDPGWSTTPNDLLVHLALSQFPGAPKYRGLPRSIQADLKSFVSVTQWRWRKVVVLFAAGNRSRGRYDWHFASDDRCLIEKLVITIDVTQVFPNHELVAIMGWLSSLHYPWCTPDGAIASMPAIEGLTSIGNYLNEVRPMLPER
jgi:hypothetical protein